MVDRFNNPDANPRSTTADPPMAWNQRFDFRQGGTFKGIQEQLGYIESLGARAIWLSPVLKNSMADWPWNYHGYGAQDFLAVDERFASDGTRETAERELAELVTEAHARGIYVILDIVINHAGRVFDYERGGNDVMSFADQYQKDIDILELPDNKKQQHGTHGRGDDRPDQPDRLEPEQAENEAPDDGADDTNHDIAEQAEAAPLHHVSGYPTGQRADGEIDD